MAMETDDHGISYESSIFRRDRDEEDGIDWLWVTDGSGYVDIPRAEANELDHYSHDFEFIPEDGELRKDGEWYKLKLIDGAQFNKDVVKIPAYYID